MTTRQRHFVLRYTATTRADRFGGGERAHQIQARITSFWHSFTGGFENSTSSTPGWSANRGISMERRFKMLLVAPEAAGHLFSAIGSKEFMRLLNLEGALEQMDVTQIGIELLSPEEEY